MANFANLLKSEISRIARKEIRAETQLLKKASAQYRSEIAALKRRLADQERLLSRLRKNNRSTAPPAPAADSPKLRFRSEGFASLRKKLGVSAAEMGQLVGVSAQTIYHWEKGVSKPRSSQLAEIAAVRKLGKREVSARLSQA
ncbi:DNA-binding transcriptional regulator [Rhodoferax sp. BAB1]|uniref:helix-turn-helix domain-containing protein n=1 Tax=Rhodoferax sp. BAB1 TaxID=2741720 RepID=UPI00157675C9|nr:helix-turn-helix transcriptional regulator [Rhodoferax sp. BAB1]QKO21073.1 helix-turn-helix transcriptional regulator [Rhodoferax sp. BAB1]